MTVRSETPTTATEPPYPPAAPTETEVAGAGSAVERTDHRDHHPLPWDLPAEQWRLATAGGAFLLSFVVALTLMYGRRHPMFGEGSIGEYSALIAALTTAITYVVWFAWAVRGPAQRWRRRMALFLRILEYVGLTLTHAAVAMLALSGTFWILSQAFRELTLDGFAGAFIVAVGSAVTSYLVVGSALSTNTRHLSQLLAVFVASGALSSMLTASDPLWWQDHFSSLGAASDLSGLTFNFTLLLGGLVIITLSGYLTHDLAVWAELARERPYKVTVMRIAFLVEGVLLAALAFLSVDRFFYTHNVVAYAMVAVFLAMAAGVPVLFPTLSRPFSLVCALTLTALVVGLVAYLGVGYLNLTAFEVLTVAGIFTWLILLVATVESASEHRRSHPAALGHDPVVDPDDDRLP